MKGKEVRSSNPISKMMSSIDRIRETDERNVEIEEGLDVGKRRSGHLHENAMFSCKCMDVVDDDTSDTLNDGTLSALLTEDMKMKWSCEDEMGRWKCAEIKSHITYKHRSIELVGPLRVQVVDGVHVR